MWDMGFGKVISTGNLMTISEKRSLVSAIDQEREITIVTILFLVVVSINNRQRKKKDES